MKSEPEELPLETRQAQPLAVQEPSIPMLLQGMIQSGITKDNAEAMKSLLEMHERMQDRDAKRQFTEALQMLQNEMPKVKAVKPVMNKAQPGQEPTVRYHFAPYEEIMQQVQPALEKNGFSVRFNTRFSDGRMISICILTHKAGHSEPTEYSCRIGSGPPGASETQADGAAHTYAKRGALCAALNIVVEKELGEDARIIGKPITAEQADNLRARVKATKAHEGKFLEAADAATFEDIKDSKYGELDAVLTRREIAQRGAKSDKEPGETGKDLF